MSDSPPPAGGSTPPPPAAPALGLARHAFRASPGGEEEEEAEVQALAHEWPASDVLSEPETEGAPMPERQGPLGPEEDPEALRTYFVRNNASFLAALHRAVGPPWWEARRMVGLPLLLGMTGRVLKTPTASKLSYEVLHPVFYRNVQRISSMHHLAQLLGAPADWEGRVEAAISSPAVVAGFQAFHRARNSPERYLEGNLGLLIFVMGLSLGSELASAFPRTLVSGLLAQAPGQEPLAVRGEADVCFVNTDGEYVLSFEVKTDYTFVADDVWYRVGGPQLLSVLFATNAPSFLVTGRKWKVLVEDGERTQLFTYPWNDRALDNMARVGEVGVMGEDFLRAVGICILARMPATRGAVVPSTPSRTSKRAKTGGMGKASAAKPRRGSARTGPFVRPAGGPSTPLAGRAEASLRRQHRAFLGMEDGRPVYHHVQTATDEAAGQLHEYFAEEDLQAFLVRAAEEAAAARDAFARQPMRTEMSGSHQVPEPGPQLERVPEEGMGEVVVVVVEEEEEEEEGGGGTSPLPAKSRAAGTSIAALPSGAAAGAGAASTSRAGEGEDVARAG